MSSIKKREEIHKSEKSWKENPKVTLYGKKGFTTKERVTSNLPVSSVNSKKTTYVLLAIQQVHLGKSHLGP